MVYPQNDKQLFWASSFGTGGVIQEEVLRKAAKDQGVSEDVERGRGGYSEENRRDSSTETFSFSEGRERRDLTEQGQSFDYSDNQGGNSQSAMSKSEGKLLEDVKAGEPLLPSAFISHSGRPVLASPNDDYPLQVTQRRQSLFQSGCAFPNGQQPGTVGEYLKMGMTRGTQTTKQRRM
jgi:hypothetical protein